MTYEVRRYFRKKPGDAGVIVAKIEPGSKASVSGLKPYEIITHINDKLVRSVEDFEKLIAGQSELRLAVKRMTRGRVVKIKMAGEKAPTSGPATRATPPAP
jgi:S1-C subfamily serine protease